MTAFLWVSFAFFGVHTLLDLWILSQDGVDTAGLVSASMDGGMLGAATYLLAVN